MENILIRKERKEDYRETENLVRESFWNVYRPGCNEHFLLHCLRDDPDFVDELDFVLVKKEKIIGQVVYVKAVITSDCGEKIPVLTMGPISILPMEKRKGYGKMLLDFSLLKAKELGYGAVCIEGNIDFYKNCGFTYASDFGIRYHGLCEGDDSSFFLCRELIPGFLSNKKGEYETPRGYFVDEDKLELFDKTFESKEKLVLPGQIF